MDEPTRSTLARIAEALERLAPPQPPAPDFAAARLFRHDPAGGAFVPAPDFALQLDLLVGVERQKLRFAENLEPLRRAACRPTTCCCGACAAPARARWPRPAFMAVARRARRR